MDFAFSIISVPTSDGGLIAPAAWRYSPAIRRRLVLREQLGLNVRFAPQKRTLELGRAMSALCQKRTLTLTRCTVVKSGKSNLDEFPVLPKGDHCGLR
jgi:hypothetical protein